MTKDTQLSSDFKAQTQRAIIAIVFFVLSYIFILLLATALTALCIYGGIMLVAELPGLITIVVGMGLASLGILVLIFLLKFIFKSYKVDRSHLYEVKREEEPELFSLIDEIVGEVQTSFPKKVYLSTDINAAVFYDSSFWSMFFPVRKNLQIGLGLVNTVSRVEFKAILAHEFGHFSQKTMKVGSYVYNVNQVIYNMIYQDESYNRLIQNWASVNVYFWFFVSIAVKIIQGIQWMLRKLYGVVNKRYMALSREMEFHADEIAASITGFEPLKTSLLRLSLADNAFHAVLSFYHERVKDNLKSKNVYKEQFFVMNFLAKQSDLPIEHKLPQLSVQALNKFNKSKLVIKDQWASHPSLEDRIASLEKTAIAQRDSIDGFANDIFTNIERLQEAFTNNIFKELGYTADAKFMAHDDFRVAYEKEFLSYSFSEMYKGYYDHKHPLYFEVDTIDASTTEIQEKDLFADDKLDLVYTAIALQNDIETLKQITTGLIEVKTLDYDGERYSRKQSKVLLNKLTVSLEQKNDQIRQNDIKVFQFFEKCEQAKNLKPRLGELYKSFFDFDKEFDAKYEIYTSLSNGLQFINVTNAVEQIKMNFFDLEPLELKLKEEIKALMINPVYKSEIKQDIVADFELYLSKKWRYFGRDMYFDENLNMLFRVMNNYVFVLSKGYFVLKREILNYQEELIR